MAHRVELGCWTTDVVIMETVSFEGINTEKIRQQQHTSFIRDFSSGRNRTLTTHLLCIAEGALLLTSILSAIIWLCVTLALGTGNWCCRWLQRMCLESPCGHNPLFSST